MKAVLATLFTALVFVACTKKESAPEATAPAADAAVTAPADVTAPAPAVEAAPEAPQTEPAPEGK